jgi:hypothetical protein
VTPPQQQDLNAEVIFAEVIFAEVTFAEVIPAKSPLRTQPAF